MLGKKRVYIELRSIYWIAGPILKFQLFQILELMIQPLPILKGKQYLALLTKFYPINVGC